MKHEIEAYKFSPNAKGEIAPSIIGENETVQDFIKRQLSSCVSLGYSNILRSGVYQLMGWRYDLKPFLKKFWYKRYGQIEQAYALNKTQLRKIIHGKIDEIHEV